MKISTRIVAREDKLSESSKTFLVKGSLRIYDAGIPVFMRNLDNQMVGVASELERDDETGAVSLLFAVDDWIDMDKYTTILNIPNPTYYTEDDVRRVIDGVVRGVTLKPFIRPAR